MSNDIKKLRKQFKKDDVDLYIEVVEDVPMKTGKRRSYLLFQDEAKMTVRAFPSSAFQNATEKHKGKILKKLQKNGLTAHPSMVNIAN